MRGLRRRLESVGLAQALVARWTEVAAYASSIVAFFVFAHLALARHDSFESNAYDLGFFDQIIWNTAHGRWFETTFTPYNFLGQHWQPVLLLFAGAYRLGAGVETLLVAQAFFVAAAAVPLYYAARRATGSGIAGLGCAAAFVLNPSLHAALDFDFHPELLGFFFVFLAAYALVARRPLATIVSLLPLLLLKEDMPLIVLAFAVLLLARGHRRHAIALAAIALAHVAMVVLYVMPEIRGGSGDLAGRYSYLIEDSTPWTLVPHVVSRAVDDLAGAPARAVVGLGASLGFVPLLSPLTVVAAVPTLLLALLSTHQQQSALELQYAVPSLALAFVATVLALGFVACRAPKAQRRNAAAIAATIMFVAGAVSFVTASPYSPFDRGHGPSEQHRAAAQAALALIPNRVPVSAQGTLLPHLSQRQSIYEFPNIKYAAYVVIDPTLPVTAQSRAAGYERQVASLEGGGWALLYDRDGVRVYRRIQ